MKIVLICGMSGVGKTTIAQKLCEKYDDKYNFVSSYTDRKKRNKDEWGHTFINSALMDSILEHDDVVAQTKIDKSRYCSTVSQFDKNKVNLYIVDVDGINNVIKNFPTAEIMIVLINRREVEVDCVRTSRNVLVPAREDVHFLVNNNGDINSPVNLLNALVNFDLFNKPSHIVSTLNDRLDDIEERYRYLDEIQTSLYKQMFYQEQPHYNALCNYVEEKINEDYDFKITIAKDIEPDITYDDGLVFNIIAEYGHADLMWAQIYDMVEKLTRYAYSYCKTHELENISCRLSIFENCVGEYEA